MTEKSQKPVNVAYEQPLIPKIDLQKVRLLWAKLKQGHTLFFQIGTPPVFFSYYMVQLEISKLQSATATTYTKYVMNYLF